VRRRQRPAIAAGSHASHCPTRSLSCALLPTMGMSSLAAGWQNGASGWVRGHRNARHPDTTQGIPLSCLDVLGCHLTVVAARRWSLVFAAETPPPSTTSSDAHGKPHGVKVGSELAGTSSAPVSRTAPGSVLAAPQRCGTQATGTEHHLTKTSDRIEAPPGSPSARWPPAGPDQMGRQQGVQEQGPESGPTVGAGCPLAPPRPWRQRATERATSPAREMDLTGHGIGGQAEEDMPDEAAAGRSGTVTGSALTALPQPV